MASSSAILGATDTSASPLAGRPAGSRILRTVGDWSEVLLGADDDGEGDSEVVYVHVRTGETRTSKPREVADGEVGRGSFSVVEKQGHADWARLLSESEVLRDALGSSVAGGPTSAADAGSGGWWQEMQHSDTLSIFYHDPRTGECRWSKPEEVRRSEMVSRGEALLEGGGGGGRSGGSGRSGGGGGTNDREHQAFLSTYRDRSQLIRTVGEWGELQDEEGTTWYCRQLGSGGSGSGSGGGSGNGDIPGSLSPSSSSSGPASALRPRRAPLEAWLAKDPPEVVVTADKACRANLLLEEAVRTNSPEYVALLERSREDRTLCDWSELRDFATSNSTLYIHRLTREVQWMKPAALVEMEQGLLGLSRSENAIASDWELLLQGSKLLRRVTGDPPRMTNSSALASSSSRDASTLLGDGRQEEAPVVDVRRHPATGAIFYVDHRKGRRDRAGGGKSGGKSAGKGKEGKGNKGTLSSRAGSADQCGWSMPEDMKVHDARLRMSLGFSHASQLSKSKASNLASNMSFKHWQRLMAMSTPTRTIGGWREWRVDTLRAVFYERVSFAAAAGGVVEEAGDGATESQGEDKSEGKKEGEEENEEKGGEVTVEDKGQERKKKAEPETKSMKSKQTMRGKGAAGGSRSGGGGGGGGGGGIDPKMYKAEGRFMFQKPDEVCHLDAAQVTGAGAVVTEAGTEATGGATDALPPPPRAPASALGLNSSTVASSLASRDGDEATRDLIMSRAMGPWQEWVQGSTGATFYAHRFQPSQSQWHKPGKMMQTEGVQCGWVLQTAPAAGGGGGGGGRSGEGGVRGRGGRGRGASGTSSKRGAAMDTTTMLHGAGANGSMTTYTVSGSKEDWASMRRIAVAIRSDLDPDHGYIMDILLNGL